MMEESDYGGDNAMCIFFINHLTGEKVREKHNNTIHVL